MTSFLLFHRKRSKETEKWKKEKCTTIQRFSVSPVPLYSASPIYEVRFLLFRYKKLKRNLSEKSVQHLIYTVYNTYIVHLTTVPSIATGHNNSAHLTFHTTLLKKNRYFVEVEADMPCAYEKHMLMLSNNLAFLDFDLFLFRFRGYNTLFIQYYSVICCPSDHTVGRLRAMQDSNPGRAIYREGRFRIFSFRQRTFQLFASRPCVSVTIYSCSFGPLS